MLKWKRTNPFKKKVTQSKASEVEKVLLGFPEGSFDKKNTAQSGAAGYRNTLLRCCGPAPGTDHLQNCFSKLPIQAGGSLSCFHMCKVFSGDRLSDNLSPPNREAPATAETPRKKRKTKAAWNIRSVIEASCCPICFIIVCEEEKKSVKSA